MEPCSAIYLPFKKTTTTKNPGQFRTYCLNLSVILAQYLTHGSCSVCLLDLKTGRTDRFQNVGDK